MVMRRRLLAFLAVFLFVPVVAQATTGSSDSKVPANLNDFPAAQLQSLMSSGQLSSVRLTRYYLSRILGLDKEGPGVNSVIELNPDALEMAEAADSARHKGGTHGPLLGIPILLKDNIDTGDKMQTSAGSFALVGKPASQDATVAGNLRKAGAVIL